MANQIAVKDQSLADAWVAKANALNERAKEANTRIGQLLEELGQKAVGDIVDKFVAYGTQLLKRAQEIFEAVTAIAKTVKEVVDTLKGTLENLVNTARSIIGRA